MSTDGYVLTTQTLIKEAADWDDEAEKLQQMARAAAQLELDRAHSGIFQMMTPAVQEVVQTFVTRSLQGCQEMHQIAQALRTTAQNYEVVEHQTAQSFHALHT
ncbi:type VII secretion target [Streptacidiphilus jiangxiensis]|uniref:Excreted virulence factor EspC, type VII ESX diderm n=1 Tax=Streptacidiphilus jiangxiensis TaxID=235985 RepID=A0A1H7FCH4_STRJI|nr:type VII secretion target [Streptacidiphilus jiangxiensis]SEK23853.1 Excreted virulence factor EspC, type VII ESX diderm [Streptacidiphilus jiangxiensis]